MKTFLMTMVVKTILGYLFIQEIKNFNATIGVPLEHDPAKEIFMAAVLPHPWFLAIGLFSFLLVWSFRNANSKDLQDDQDLDLYNK